MHRLRFLPVLILVIVPSLLWSQESYVAPKRLWSWFGDCGQKKYVGLEVALSRKVIYRSSFPVCPIEDYSENVKDLLSARGSPGRKLVFSFKGGHVFQGEYRTTPTQTIEANVWQSGTGPGVILLGLSFSTKKQLLLNTIHVAQMDGVIGMQRSHGLSHLHGRRRGGRPQPVAGAEIAGQRDGGVIRYGDDAGLSRRKSVLAEDDVLHPDGRGFGPSKIQLLVFAGAPDLASGRDGDLDGLRRGGRLALQQTFDEQELMRHAGPMGGLSGSLKIGELPMRGVDQGLSLSLHVRRYERPGGLETQCQGSSFQDVHGIPPPNLRTVYMMWACGV